MMFKPVTLLKATLSHGCFSRFTKLQMVQNRAMHRRYFFNTDFNTNVEELHELFDLKAAPYLSYINSIKILFNEKIER